MPIRKKSKPIMVVMRVSQKHREKLDWLRDREYGGITHFFEKCLEDLDISNPG